MLYRTLRASLALGLLTALASSQVEVGDTPEYSFRKPPLNSLGLSNLDDLQGRPLLVEFWGTR